MGGKRAKQGKAFSLGEVLVKIFRVRAWKLILLALLSGFVAATLLRFDHITMSNLKASVLEADKSGDEEKLLSSLNELSHFTTSHIIFNLVDENGKRHIEFGTGPFYLEETYRRKAEAELKKAQELANQQSGDTNPNGNIYAKVSAICDEQGKQHGWRYPDQPYIDCWVRELATYPSADQIDIFNKADLPDTSLYRREFASPVWYPCASGLVLLLCAILVFWALARMLIWLFTIFSIFVLDRMD